jgi:peptide-methionine (S)-S-oxide reductase
MNQTGLNPSAMIIDDKELKTATLGSGCFWCTEAIFQRMKGVVKVESGYSGGKIRNPTYREVCSGLTGHAEVVQITYDVAQISFEDLLEVFFSTHDPTTLNRQGADAGTQYRSVIFFHDEEQQRLAGEFRQRLNESKAFRNPVVTEIAPFTEFFVAEDYHQNYFNENGEAPYCQFVIAPKLDKFTRTFKERMKEG